MSSKSNSAVPKPSFPVEGLLPKQASGADAFLKRFPEYDGRNVRVAVLDTGVDPAAVGLDGPNKVVDVIDCSGAGDITLKQVEATPTEDGSGLALVSPTTKRTLIVSPEWKNPTGIWKVGTKPAYDLWPTELISRRKKQRRAAFDLSHAAVVQRVQYELAQLSDTQKERKEELQTRLELLRDLQKAWKDAGPLLETVVFHDGNDWRAVVAGGEGESVDSSHGEPASVRADRLDLRSLKPMTDFRKERQWAYFGSMDLLTYTVNILDDGNLLSLVTLSGTHGTHVAGIIAAQSDEQETNGVAPGAEIVSLRIGDSRLASMEQGQALLRAAQAIIDTRCDVANMSFGEDGALGVENRGAFTQALRTIIDQHDVCFVSSAGNDGPALSTVGQPGGTTSGVLSVGAYVTEGEMQKAEYALVESGVKSSVTTWSSRGPAFDGDRGVSIYAPGAAITSICRYALQSKQLMNGTSMSSPNAAGAVALLVSALKAQGRRASPARIFAALRETGDDVNDALDVRFMNVIKAYEYLEAHAEEEFEDLRFAVQVTPPGKVPGKSDDLRGIYLREAPETHRLNQFQVNAKPQFRQEDTQQAFSLELRTRLESTQPWIEVPEFLVLGSNGRSFEVRVAAHTLEPGLHVGWVKAYNTNALGTKVFEVPVVVTKPHLLQTPAFEYPAVHLGAGAIHREFIQVPNGATWAEIRICGRNYEVKNTSARFWLHMLQLIPQARRSKIEHAFVLNLSENEPVVKRIGVEHLRTIEICAAQFWASKAGFDLELQVEFHGLDTGASLSEPISLVGGNGLQRVNVTSRLRIEECKPSATLDARRTFVRPTKSTVAPLLLQRDRMPSGRQLNELVLEYPLSFKEESSCVTFQLPISNHVYDNSVTLLTQIVDQSRKCIAFGDVYPKELSLERGDYTLYAQILHEDNNVLESLRSLPLAVDEKLSKPKEISLDIYPSHVAAYGSSKLDSKPAKLDMVKLHPGQRRVLCIDANLEGDRLPQAAKTGDLLLGTLALNEHDKHPLRVVMPPAPVPSKSTDSSEETEPKLAALLAELVPKLKGEEQKTFAAKLVAKHPDDLNVLLAQLQTLDVESKDEAENTLAAANSILQKLDANTLLLWRGEKHIPTNEQSTEQKALAKQRESEIQAYETALVRRAKAYLLLNDSQAFADAIQEARRFLSESGTDSKAQTLHTNLLVQWHMQHERLGTATRLLKKQLEDMGRGTSETRDALQKARQLQLDLFAQLGWDIWHHNYLRWQWLSSNEQRAPF
ncbi:tripeptidyl-peptidase II [Malassezia yamatoensis]|uniref:tripeptidyl-peptidase II n=1 Tax=Malassezia yamatoensis TaxID=253288 RepID=A0AAJ5YUE3_9BASI|nr:tripeptidyl-peptidase II [Malassezia yamatoensis]